MSKAWRKGQVPRIRRLRRGWRSRLQRLRKNGRWLRFPSIRSWLFIPQGNGAGCKPSWDPAEGIQGRKQRTDRPRQTFGATWPKSSNGNRLVRNPQKGHRPRGSLGFRCTIRDLSQTIPRFRSTNPRPAKRNRWMVPLSRNRQRATNLRQRIQRARGVDQDQNHFRK